MLYWYDMAVYCHLLSRRAFISLSLDTGIRFYIFPFRRHCASCVLDTHCVRLSNSVWQCLWNDSRTSVAAIWMCACVTAEQSCSVPDSVVTVLPHIREGVRGWLTRRFNTIVPIFLFAFAHISRNLLTSYLRSLCLSHVCMSSCVPCGNGTWYHILSIYDVIECDEIRDLFLPICILWVFQCIVFPPIVLLRFTRSASKDSIRISVMNGYTLRYIVTFRATSRLLSEYGLASSLACLRTSAHLKSFIAWLGLSPIHRPTSMLTGTSSYENSLFDLNQLSGESFHHGQQLHRGAGKHHFLQGAQNGMCLSAVLNGRAFTYGFASPITYLIFKLYNRFLKWHKAIIQQ